MAKLIYDSAITGHHSEYISHLVNYLSKYQSADVYYFVVSEEFKSAFPEIINKSTDCPSIIWELIPISRLKKMHKLSLVKRSFAELALVNEYVKEHSIKEVYLLYFNIFQIALIFKRPSFKVHGILFLQFYRMEQIKIKDKLKYYRKYLITKFYTLNRKIENVFILNDQKTVDYLNEEFRTSQFKMLPDPIPLLNPIPGFDVYKHYDIDRNCKIFLHIGSLGDRKGTFEIIESAKYIPQDAQNKIAILLVGKANEHDSSIMSLKVKKVANESKVVVLWDKQFVSNEMMKSLFDQCYAVLIPYKNAEASSGILGHAAMANKAVIAPKSGLLKEIIENYNLGVLIDKVESDFIAEAIVSLMESNICINKNNDFIKLHTNDIFATKLLN